MPVELQIRFSVPNNRGRIVEFEIPKKIFTKYDVESGVEDNLVVKLWDFN